MFHGAGFLDRLFRRQSKALKIRKDIAFLIVPFLSFQFFIHARFLQWHRPDHSS